MWGGGSTAANHGRRLPLTTMSTTMRPADHHQRRRQPAHRSVRPSQPTPPTQVPLHRKYVDVHAPLEGPWARFCRIPLPRRGVFRRCGGRGLPPLAGAGRPTVQVTLRVFPCVYRGGVDGPGSRGSAVLSGVPAFCRRCHIDPPEQSLVRCAHAKPMGARPRRPPPPLTAPAHAGSPTRPRERTAR